MEPALVLPLIIAVLALLAGTLFGWIAFFRGLALERRLDQALQRLNRRLERIDDALAALPAPTTSATSAASSSPPLPAARPINEIVQRVVEQAHARAAAPVASPPATAAVAPTPSAPAESRPHAPIAGAAAPPPPIDAVPRRIAASGEVDWARLEAMIGERWLTWVGALVVFVAGAFAVRWAFVNGVIGPVGRMALGLVIGAATIVGGDRVVARGVRPVGQALIALGIGLLYAAWFSGYALGDTPPLGQLAAFVGMAVVTLLAVALALRHDAPALASLATIGALLTPVLVGKDGGSRDGLFAYLLALDVGAALLALARRWPWPRRIAFVGTLVIAGAWCGKHPELSHDLGIAGWQAAFAALFLAAPLGYHARRREPVSLDALVLVIANACAAVTGIWATQGEARPEFAAAWVALLAAPHALAVLGVRTWFGGDQRAGGALVAIASALVAAAVAMQWDGHVVTWAWAAQAALLLWLGWRYATPATRGVGGAIALLVAVRGATALTACAESEPLLNPGVAASLAGPALLAWAALLARANGASLRLEALVARWGLTCAQLMVQAWLTIDLVRVLDRASCEPIAALWLIGTLVGALAARGMVAAPSLGAFGISAVVAAVAVLAAYVEQRDPWSPRWWLGLTWIGLVLGAARRWREGDGELLPLARRTAGIAIGVGGWLLLSLQGWVAAIAWWDRRAALVTLSALWMAYACGALVLGMRLRLRPLRLASLGLFGVAMAKLALVDLSYLHDLQRIASFAIVGLVMIGASWLYHRLEQRYGGG